MMFIALGQNYFWCSSWINSWPNTFQYILCELFNVIPKLTFLILTLLIMQTTTILIYKNSQNFLLDLEKNSNILFNENYLKANAEKYRVVVSIVDVEN